MSHLVGINHRRNGIDVALFGCVCGPSLDNPNEFVPVDLNIPIVSPCLAGIIPRGFREGVLVPNPMRSGC